MSRLARPLPITALLLAAALAAWIITVERMRGMDAGPGTDLGGLGWYVGIWVTMTAAMMLPSAAPMVLLFARVSAEQRRRAQLHVSTAFFVAGYIAVWTVYGLAAYGLFRAIVAGGTDFLAWDRAGPYVAGAAVGAAGVYELTPLKGVCLRHCRTPLHFILGGWRRGRLGALGMGAEHGTYCVGCCWGLMVVLFAVGVMSLFWMALVAGVVFMQKLAPGAERLEPAVAAVLVGLGIWIATAPASVPGLVEPSSAAAKRARMRMMHMEPAKTKPGSMSPVPMKPAKRMKP